MHAFSGRHVHCGGSRRRCPVATSCEVRRFWHKSPLASGQCHGLERRFSQWPWHSGLLPLQVSAPAMLWKSCERWDANVWSLFGRAEHHINAGLQTQLSTTFACQELSLREHLITCRDSRFCWVETGQPGAKRSSNFFWDVKACQTASKVSTSYFLRLSLLGVQSINGRRHCQPHFVMRVSQQVYKQFPGTNTPTVTQKMTSQDDLMQRLSIISQ